jgi:hypothetical protein
VEIAGRGWSPIHHLTSRGTASLPLPRHPLCSPGRWPYRVRRQATGDDMKTTTIRFKHTPQGRAAAEAVELNDVMERHGVDGVLAHRAAKERVKALQAGIRAGRVMMRPKAKSGRLNPRAGIANRLIRRPEHVGIAELEGLEGSGKDLAHPSTTRITPELLMDPLDDPTFRKVHVAWTTRKAVERAARAMREW